MSPLVAKVIEESFAVLDTGGAQYDQDFLAVASTDPAYEEPFVTIEGITSCPVLYRASTGIACAQSSYFGFYVMQRALRSLLLSVNHCAAGYVLLETGLHGPTVAAFYTAAYHALHGFLALDGRVFLEDTIWPVPAHQPSGKPDDGFIAVLTRGKKWIVESRPRNHRGRWLEVEQVYGNRANDLPQCFHLLFDYLFRGACQAGVSRIEVIKNPEKYRIGISDRLHKFLVQIAKARHDSLYASFGSDPSVAEAVWNGDAYSDRGIENQALNFGAFAAGLLDVVAKDLEDLTDRLILNGEIRKAIGLWVYTRWFDSPKLDFIGNYELRRRIEKVKHWLIDGVHAEATYERS